MSPRPSKDEYYLKIAEAISLRAPCLRRRYGAIVVKDDVIVATGYNGTPRGVINCIEVGCLKDKVGAPHGSGYEFCPAVHSEENAIINAARTGANVFGGTMYVFGRDVNTGRVYEAIPCDRCKRAIINAGIRELMTMKENGEIERIGVSNWVREQSEDYKKKLGV